MFVQAILLSLEHVLESGVVWQSTHVSHCLLAPLGHTLDLGCPDVTSVMVCPAVSVTCRGRDCSGGMPWLFPAGLVTSLTPH